MGQALLLAGERTPREWAAEINLEWRKSADSVIRTGRLLDAAIQALPHGDRMALYEGLDFSRQTANKLVLIGRDERIAECAHGRNLPPSWRTLYELTRYDDAQWERAMNDGLITANLERQEVIAFRKQLAVSGRTNSAPPALPDGKYGLIYADPPWRYDHSKTDNRKIENNYPTLSLDEICELPIEQLAADDCALFLWATSPKLRQAMGVLDAWGFVYRTCAVWDKQKIGMGYYFRQQHELLLVAARGSPAVPEPGARVSSVFSAPRSEHSSKPKEVYGILERMYPTAPRIELFARHSEPGWSTWGNDACL